jgi:glutamyl-Q tRNA(Asp) synthetase
VVVDDEAAGINQVVRGADLLSSTPRQIFLHACLGNLVPEYIHLPLAMEEEGKKISKRHGPVQLDYDHNSAELIARSLSFLGQIVPGNLRGAPPKELLAWAVQNFDQSKIPVSAEGLMVTDFPL